MLDQLLTTSQAARYLAVSKAFLERDRWLGPKIPYITVGSRSVRYRQSDLEQYLASQRTERG